MKKSELQNYIKENIISTLSEDKETQQNIKDTEDLTKAMGDLAKAKEEAGLEEANISIADLGEMGYENGEKAFDMHFDKSILNNTPDTKAYAKGFVQAIVDSAGSLRLNEDEDEEKPDGMDVFFGADAKDKMKDRREKAVDFLQKHKEKYGLKEDEDKEPSKSDLKKTKGLAKAKEELALLTREMKSLAKKYSKAEGEEKEKLVKVLKDKTKLKKELESILDK